MRRSAHTLGVDDALTLTELLQRAFRLLKLLAQSGKTLSEPGARLLRHCQAGIHVGFDEAVGNPVGGGGGEFLVRTFVADPDQLAVSHQFDGEFLLESGNHRGLQLFRA
jgi:hypothetical protein